MWIQPVWNNESKPPTETRWNEKSQNIISANFSQSSDSLVILLLKPSGPRYKNIHI